MSVPVTPTGTVSVGKLSVTTDSLFLGQLQDVDVADVIHNDVLIYKDSTISPDFTTGWHNAPLGLGDVSGVELVLNSDPDSDLYPDAVGHNEVLAYNLTDNSFPKGWVNRSVSSLFTGLETTIAGIVNSAASILRGQSGNSALTDMVVLSSDPLSTSVTVTLGSNDDQNVLFKRELTDAEHIFVQILNKGETTSLDFPIGTALKASKGVFGFSGPFPTPLGMPSMSLKTARFSTFVANSTLTVASSGTQVTVTLFEADGLTISDGPVEIAANAVASLSCSGTGEFIVASTGYIMASVNANGSNIRVLPPMCSELIVWNRGCSISNAVGTASVEWYRQNGEAGTESVTAGTPVAFTAAGSNSNYAPEGCLILRSDKPVSSFASGDSGGSVCGWPLDQLAQRFANPGFIDNSSGYDAACVAIGSPFEGTARVYDSDGNLLDSFSYTRGTQATSAADQLYPAAGRWKPSDVTGSTTWNGGYVTTTTPAVCLMRLKGSPDWTNDYSAKEINIAGTTPKAIAADITRDSNGLMRVRVVDSSGTVAWTIC